MRIASRPGASRRAGPVLRHGLRAGFGAGLVLLLVLLSAGGAAAATRYRYWSYWKADHGSWRYATVGPASVPPDGSVEGWRYAASAEGQAPAPRRAPSFAALCAAVPAKAGHKRVGVVIDYGLSRDAPAGETPPAAVEGRCAQLAPDANGYAVLQAVAGLRTATSGLVCAVHGYPRTGCGDAVGAATSSQAARPASSVAPVDSTSTSGPFGIGASVGALAGIAVAVVLGAAALLRARRAGR